MFLVLMLSLISGSTGLDSCQINAACSCAVVVQLSAAHIHDLNNATSTVIKIGSGEVQKAGGSGLQRAPSS